MDKQKLFDNIIFSDRKKVFQVKQQGFALPGRLHALNADRKDNTASLERK